MNSHVLRQCRPLGAIIKQQTMGIISKLKEIVDLQKNYSDEIFGEFTSPILDEQILQIEKLIEEPLPIEFRKLYRFSNGQTNVGNGILFGERFIGADEIIRQLEFSRTLIKPERRTIDNPEKSDQLIKKVINFYIAQAPRHKLFRWKKSWFKMEFSCGIGSYGGPYIYATENTTPDERSILEIKSGNYKTLESIINELHELEEFSYNWDELKFVVFSNGKYEVERTFYDFDNQIQFTSTPEKAVKQKYFHYKWVPLFSDFAGNYIGIDLDPDTAGKKGQVINFGRDEEKMFVLGDSIENFFEFILMEIKKPNNKLVNSESHIHDILRELKNNCA